MEIVFGLLDNSESIGDPALAAKFRDLTLWWSRYDYHGVVLEGSDVRALLDQAVASGHRYCFIQSYGNLLRERWTPESAEARGFLPCLERWLEGREFLVAGNLLDGQDDWYGVDPRCFVVDLERYAAVAETLLDPACTESIELPKPEPVLDGSRLSELRPGSESESVRPRTPAWNLVAASLRAGLPVPAFGPELMARTLDLEAQDRKRSRALARYFGSEVSKFREAGADELGADQRTFLEIIDLQTANAKRGVFLWNIEGYADIETPPAEFAGPVSTLYSVAAGFKPYRILRTHGFDKNSRVVFFDYSPNALEVKRRTLKEWDGADFPEFAKYLFGEFPHPETFYQLWADASPEELDWSLMTAEWERELERWGGARAFQEHWRACRELEHEFVHCDILQDPWKLIQRVRTEPNGIVWWSNAFFTMGGNWFHDVEQRRLMYERWSEWLAATSPNTLLYGSDYNNENVNCMTAGEYWVRHRNSSRSALEPCKLSRVALRM